VEDCVRRTFDKNGHLLRQIVLPIFFSLSNSNLLLFSSCTRVHLNYNPFPANFQAEGLACAKANRKQVSRCSWTLLGIISIIVWLG